MTVVCRVDGELKEAERILDEARAIAGATDLALEGPRH